MTDFSEYVGQEMNEVLQVVEAEKTKNWSIEDIALQLYTDLKKNGHLSKHPVNLLMFRVQLVSPDDYWEQEWLEDTRNS